MPSGKVNKSASRIGFLILSFMKVETVFLFTATSKHKI